MTLADSSGSRRLHLRFAGMEPLLQGGSADLRAEVPVLFLVTTREIYTIRTFFFLQNFRKIAATSLRNVNDFLRIL